MRLLQGIGVIGCLLVLLVTEPTDAGAAPVHLHGHAARRIADHVEARGGFGRSDPDNYGAYGGPEAGYFHGPSWGPARPE